MKKYNSVSKATVGRGNAKGVGMSINRKFFKWMSVAVGGALLAFLIYGLMQPDAVPPDYFHGIKRDLGPGPEKRVMSYVQSHMMIGNSTYDVSLGVSQFDSNLGDDWDYCFLWITKMVPDEEFGERGYRFWSRWLPISEVPDVQWTKKVETVVSYDEGSRTVTLDCGFTNYTCVLPPGEGSEYQR